MKKTNKVKIGEFKHGDVEVPDDLLDPKNHKVRITLFLDGDILMPFKDFASATGGKYQTLINECLKEYTMDFLKTKVRAVERGIAHLKKKASNE